VAVRPVVPGPVRLTDAHGALPLNVQVVLSGQGRLDARCWADSLDLIHEVPLDIFTEDDARALLARRGVTDERVVEGILRLSGRLPVLLDTLAQARPQDPDDVGDPSGTAVDRFLKWITESHRQEAALACALPLQLNEDLYRAAAPEPAADDYPWLRGQPFVVDQAGRCRYHDVVRDPMVRLQHNSPPPSGARTTRVWPPPSAHGVSRRREPWGRRGAGGTPRGASTA
jgi:hypothetical protein